MRLRSSPLTAISAAVVGVILSLAVFFAEQVFHLSEPLALWDKTALLISVVAAIALLRFAWGAIRLIAVCAVAGLVVSYVPWW